MRELTPLQHGASLDRKDPQQGANLGQVGGEGGSISRYTIQIILTGTRGRKDLGQHTKTFVQKLC